MVVMNVDYASATATAASKLRCINRIFGAEHVVFVICIVGRLVYRVELALELSQNKKQKPRLEGGRGERGPLKS